MSCDGGRIVVLNGGLGVGVEKSLVRLFLMIRWESGDSVVAKERGSSSDGSSWPSPSPSERQRRAPWGVDAVGPWEKVAMVVVEVQEALFTHCN